MGLRIAAIITLATLFSYLHLVRTLRGEALMQLELHVKERLEREQSIFVLAENNHSLLKTALEEQLQACEGQDPDARFDSLFMPYPTAPSATGPRSSTASDCQPSWSPRRQDGRRAAPPAPRLV